MNDKELADRIVALGVAFRVDDIYYGLGDVMAEPIISTKEANKFVRDWRVAAAMMEKVLPHAITITAWHGEPQVHVGDPRDSRRIENESLPRAINEACCAALEEST